MKKNIFFCRCSKVFITKEIIKKLKESKDIGDIYVASYLDNIESLSRDAFCFLREDCLTGNYERYVKELNLELRSLDAPFLLKINSFITEIMIMQRRFEERIPLWISSKLKDHYWLAMQHVLFWFTFLKEKNINTVVFSDVPHEAYDTVVYELCNLIGIKAIVYRSLFKTDRFFVIQNYGEMEKLVKDEYDKLWNKSNDVDEFNIKLTDSVDKFYQSLKTKQGNKTLFQNDTMREREFVYRFGKIGIKAFIEDSVMRFRMLKKIPASICEKYNITQTVTRQIFDFCRNYRFVLKKKHDTTRFIRAYESLTEKPNKNEKYIYFALHLMPESAVIPLGEPFIDQYWAILMLSKYLPKGWKLYVKIHPAQVATILEFDDIMRIKQLDNVRIISTNADQYELIGNSQAVATLTGEIAIESLFFNKASLIFGYSPYSASPLAYRISSNDDLVEAIKHISEYGAICGDGKKKMLFKAMEDATFHGENEVIQEVVKRI